MRLKDDMCYSPKSMWSWYMWIGSIVVLLATLNLLIAWRSMFRLLYAFFYVEHNKMKSYKSESESGIYGRIYQQNRMFRDQMKEDTKKMAADNNNLSENSEIMSMLSYNSQHTPRRKTIKLTNEQSVIVSTISNLWNVLSIVGSCFQIFGSVMMMSKNQHFELTSEIVGIGIFCAWISMVRFLNNTGRYYVVFQTIKEAFPIIISIFTGFLPMYIAFAFGGAGVFFRMNRFRNIQSSLINLFPMIWGNNIYETFNGSTQLISVISHFFCYGFAMLFGMYTNK
jgi:hypothetical protein